MRWGAAHCASKWGVQVRMDNKMQTKRVQAKGCWSGIDRKQFCETIQDVKFVSLQHQNKMKAF